MAKLVLSLLLLSGVWLSAQQDEDIPHNEVKNWALKFGVDLWEFGRQFTKMDEIKRKYEEVDSEIARKDGLIIIRELASEIKNMLDFKMSAVMRIMDSSEQAALSSGIASSDNTNANGGTSVRFYNAHRHDVDDAENRVNVQNAHDPAPHAHYDHLFVNTSSSSILVPPEGPSLEDAAVQNAIHWSEHLDPLFINNYENDPSLYWQYFGSSTGFIRRYPATTSHVKNDESVTRLTTDFRTQPWFVNAATSAKDLVILVDTSGSMIGQRRALAKATLFALLDTLGDNDYVNVYKFADQTDELVPCFKDALVQANAENKRELRNAYARVTPENIANFTSALTTAFEILHRYNRTGHGCQCNQAIVLITDGAPSTFAEIFQMYNMPHRLIRVFTYLIGHDSNNQHEMSWIACDNKGYYTRIPNFETIPQKVLNYIYVMARPLVLYQNTHPIAWSSVYTKKMNPTGSGTDDRPYRLLTTVSTPVFDRRNHSVRVANLLGVVGIDIPIEQILKLIPPYKLGVNGYPFILNNNGRVLYHPDLRPLENKDGTPYYSSVDLTEVELVENESGPRENNSILQDLRHEMIDQKEGEIEMSVKVHFDSMRRVTTRRHKYFYNPIEGTPFSLGLALPDGYGLYELQAEKEVKHSPINVTEYFKGTNWRVHPDWVYCEYNSASEQWIGTAEERVLHFLTRSGAPGWKWMSMRPRSPPFGPVTSLHASVHFKKNILPKKTERETYYCDKTLLQSLVLDAMVTEELDKQNPTSHTSTHKEDKHPIATLMALLHRQGYQMFGVTLSFVATRSGLLKWVEHVTTPPRPSNVNGNTTNTPFADANARTIDEIWYKRAVDQHMIESDSFVFSVPFGSSSLYETPGGFDRGGPLVTATHAIFVDRKGHSAPAAVVGLQFQHATLASHFINITSACTGTTGCRKTCASDELDCYALDDNGFVILSENPDHTGKFFGQIDGTIMDSLVQDRIYKKVAVYDYQGACSSDKGLYSKGVELNSNPLRTIAKWFALIIQTYVTSFSWFGSTGQAFELSHLNDPMSYSDDYHYPTDEIAVEDNYVESDVPDSQPPIVATEQPKVVINKGKIVTDKTDANSDSAPIVTDSSTAQPVKPTGQNVYPCDKKVDLFVLQPERLNTSGQSSPLKGKLTNCHITGCERPFSVQKIPHSNLILLVVDTLCPCGSKQLSIEPYEIATETNQCRTKSFDALFRRRPPQCINYHPEEIEIKLCGRSNTIKLTVVVVVMEILTLYVMTAT